MTRAMELVNSVVEMGGGLTYQGDLLLAWPREKLDPMTEELRQHKQEIIAILRETGTPEGEEYKPEGECL